MKRIYHIPVEQFGFIEAEMLETEELTANVISLLVDDYRAISGAVKQPQDTGGLPDKKFNEATDKYFSEGKMDADTYAGMSTQQKDKIQWAKRSFNRTNAKNK